MKNKVIKITQDNPEIFESENIKELFEEIKPKTKEGEVITDLFYNSIKSFFEVGFDLAKNLNLELLFDSFKGPKKEEK